MSKFIFKLKHIISKNPITFMFFIINILIYIILNIVVFDKISFLALLYDELPASWYTIFTYSLVHLAWYHILINMSILVFIGSWVEKLIGGKRYFVLIIVSAIIGGLVLVIRTQSGIGFSAAAYAIIFYYYSTFPMERELPFKLPNIVFPSLLLVFTILAIVFNRFSMIAHHSHLAGAFVGILLLFFFYKKHAEI